MALQKSIEAAEIDTKQQAFLRLLEPAYDSLYKFVRALSRTPEDAEDLLADTLLAAYERFDELRDPQAFLAFLFTIAHRSFKRSLKRKRFWGVFDGAVERDLQARTQAPDVGPDIQALYVALGKLPVRQREAVIMFEISGLSLNEIRDVQGGSLSGVKSRIARARKSLAQSLGVQPAQMPRMSGSANGAIGGNASTAENVAGKPYTREVRK